MSCQCNHEIKSSVSRKRYPSKKGRTKLLQNLRPSHCASIVSTDYGRKTYAPGAWHKPVVRNEMIRVYRKKPKVGKMALTVSCLSEREFYPGPTKKQRVDYEYEFPEERRPARPVQKMPEPKPAPAAVVIEKRPVLFNPTSKSDYPPLPQRKPVQKPKAVPQPQPVKTVEKQPPKRVVNQQTKLQQSQPVVNQETQPVVKQQTKNVVGNQQTKVVGVQQTKPVADQQTKTVVADQQTKTVVANQRTNNLVAKQQTKNVVAKQQTKTVVAIQQTKTVVANQQTKAVVANQTNTVVGNQQTNTVAKPVINPEVEKQPVQTTPPKPVVQKQAPQAVQKKQEVKAETIKMEAVSTGLYPTTEKVLSEELQLIMDAITEELPAQAPSPAERHVVKRFKTDVGEEIKNALGLNVTKRLLDLHNPLYVKLEFSGKPEPGCLQEFIARHRLASFKRVAAPGDTFAAGLARFADFDRLCAARELPCGSATVTVKPCYKFLACPPTLTTVYATCTGPKNEEKQAPSNPSKQTEKKSTEEQEATEEEANKSTEENEATSIKEVDQTKETEKAIKPEVVSKASESDNQNVVETNTNVPDKDAKTADSPVKVNITIQAVSKQTENTASNEINTTKDSDKTADNATDAVDKSEEVTTTAKGIAENTGEAEINDQDILALMSGGIVLDECSGSEDEK